MFALSSLCAEEILDSRGRPTVRATCGIGIISASASVPSGASTGSAEAAELRDGGSRYGGLGCRRAVGHVNTEIAAAVAGKTFASQRQFDECLIDLDGTSDKGRLGANAVLAASLAFSRAAAATQGLVLSEYFRGLLPAGTPACLPRPTINLWSGGRHAGGQVAIQDVLIVPRAATIDDCLAMAFAVYAAATEIVKTKYGQRPLRADEGGLAPPFRAANEMFEDAVAAIEGAGLRAGADVALAVDVASSQFHMDGRYHLEGAALTASEMIDTLDSWVQAYPLVSVEDGLAEEDWQYWPELQRRLGSRVLIVGDDFLCTNPSRIRRAIAAQAANALLLKVNQIGTVTEAAHAAELARAAGWSITISARSGETEDDWLADLAFGFSGDQIKIGSITQSERLAKYNRLLHLERQTKAAVNPWPLTPR